MKGGTLLTENIMLLNIFINPVSFNLFKTPTCNAGFR